MPLNQHSTHSGALQHCATPQKHDGPHGGCQASNKRAPLAARLQRR